MAVLGSLTAILRADTRKFSRDMRGAGSSVQRMAAQVKAAGVAAARFGAVAGAAAVGGLALLMKSSLSAVDATAKLADRIGTSTEAISRLQHAAEITGAGAGLLAKSLDVMSKRLGEAAQGTGMAKKQLDALGLSAQELMSMDPAEAFRVIADRVSDLGTQQEKAAAAAGIFSRAGLALVNTLDLGREGLDAMAREADELGISFSRVDAAKVEEANDALHRMGAIFTGLGNDLAIRLAPYIQSAADAFRSWGREGQGVGELLADGLAMVVRGAIYVQGEFRKMAASVGPIFKMLGDSLTGIWDLLTTPVIGEGAQDISVLAAKLIDSTVGAYGRNAPSLASQVIGIDAETAKDLARFEAFVQRAQRTELGAGGTDAARPIMMMADAVEDMAGTWSGLVAESKAWLGNVKASTDPMVLVSESSAAASDAWSGMVEESGRFLDDMREQERIAKGMRRSLRDELDLLRAGSDYERERVRIYQTLRDRVKAAGEDEQQIALAKKIAAEELRNLSEDAAQAAEMQAKATKVTADETIRATESLRQAADITKRFDALPGSGGLFGFGAGRVGQFARFTQPGRRRSSSAPAASAASGGAAAVPGAPQLPDLSPEVDAILAEWQQVPPLWEKLGSSLRDLRKGVATGVNRMTQTTERTVGELRDAVRDVRRRVDSFEKRVSRAGTLGPAGA